MEGDGGRGLQDAFQLLGEILGIEEGHAAEEHVDPAAAGAHFRQRHAHEVIVVDVDAAREAARGHIAARLILEAAGRGVGHIVEPMLGPALGMSRRGHSHS